MAKFLHIHVGDRVAKTVVLSRDSALDLEFERRERWIEALLAKLEELDRVSTHDDAGGNQAGHPFYGNQYTDVANGPKPTDAQNKKSVKAALHELLTSGHPFSLDELMAATGSKSKSNLTTAITHLKGANPHELGVLNILKNDKGEYHLDPSKPPTLDPYVPKPKAPKPAEPTPVASKPAPAATAPTTPAGASPGPSVAKAPQKLPTTEENDAQYASALTAANEKAAAGFEKPPSQLDTKAIALQWKQDKALAMAQWKANHTGLDQKPLPQEVFKEDVALVEELALASESKDPAAGCKAAINKWKNATAQAKSAAQVAAQNKAAEAASEALKASKADKPAPVLATPVGPGAFKAPDKIVAADHKHISEEDFASGAYQSSITHLHNQLHKSASDAVSNKQKIQHALDQRLKASHHYQNMEQQHQKSGKAHYGTLSASLIQSWAGSSGDGKPTSVSAQLAIRDAFGMPNEHIETKALHLLDQVAHEDEVHKQAATQLGIDVSTPEKLASYKEGMKDFALAQYHETQDHLKKLGITELHLVRGMKVGANATAARKVKVKLQPASSFTVNHQTALSFAGGHSMFVVKVPASQVIGSFCTGYGCTSESEVVVLAHESLEAIQVGTKHASSQSAMSSHIAQGKQSGSKPQWPEKPALAGSAYAEIAVNHLKNAASVQEYVKAVQDFEAHKKQVGSAKSASTKWLAETHAVAMQDPAFAKQYKALTGKNTL